MPLFAAAGEGAPTGGFSIPGAARARARKNSSASSLSTGLRALELTALLDRLHRERKVS